VCVHACVRGFSFIVKPVSDSAKKSIQFANLKLDSDLVKPA